LVQGLISALLYAKNLNDDSQDKQQKKTINSSASSSSSTAIINETNGGAKNRLLICAPSISSLQDNGIVNARGRIMKPKMVRLGKPLDGSLQRSTSSLLTIRSMPCSARTASGVTTTHFINNSERWTTPPTRFVLIVTRSRSV
jgi:hypothetical protein